MKTKRLHLIWTLIVLGLLLFSAGWGGIWVYASHHALPRGLSLIIDGTGAGKGLTPLKSGAAVDLGSLNIADARQKLNERKAALEKLRLTVNTGSEARQKSWTLAELGLTVDTKAAMLRSLRWRTAASWSAPRPAGISQRSSSSA